MVSLYYVFLHLFVYNVCDLSSDMACPHPLAPPGEWVELTPRIICSADQLPHTSTPPHKKQRADVPATPCATPTHSGPSVDNAESYSITTNSHSLDAGSEAIPCVASSPPHSLSPWNGAPLLTPPAPTDTPSRRSFPRHRQLNPSAAAVPSTQASAPPVYPSPRHGHSITEIGSRLWLFGGMGVDLVAGNGNSSNSISGHNGGGSGGKNGSRGPSKGKSGGRGTTGRRHLNDLYVLDLLPLVHGVVDESDGKKHRQKKRTHSSCSSTLPDSASVVARAGGGSGSGSGSADDALLRWKMPRYGGAVPRRRAGHSAVAMGPHLIICGGN
jgi:hypothetical protein